MSGLSHGQSPQYVVDLFRLQFTDNFVHRCVAKHPETAASLLEAFEGMKRRNSAYFSAGDWAGIRRRNEEQMVAEPERMEIIDELVTPRSCASMRDKLSPGGELDQHIANSFPKVHGP